MAGPSCIKAFYRPGEIADLFSISKRTVYRLIKRRKLKAIKVGGSIRIPLEEIERLRNKKK